MSKNGSTPSRIWLGFFPLFVSLIVVLFLQAIPEFNPIFRFQGRLDLSTLISLFGLFLTLMLLIIWIGRVRNHRNTKRSYAKGINEAAQSRRHFLLRLDHELKNPLTALRAQLDYLSTVSALQTNQHTLEDMSTQVDRLRLLVKGLRELAELEDKQIDVSTVDVGELLSEVIEIAQTNPIYSDRQIKLILLQTPWKFTSIQGDRPLLSLAIYNLLDNALKFTSPEDSVEIRAFEMKPWLIIEIADEGSGIVDDDLPFIFDELYRGKNAIGHIGSGLGLSLVKTIIEHHNGNVFVQSRYGQGTVFSIRIPLN